MRELVETLGCARSTVNDRLESLIEHGLVVPLTDESSGPGRPSRRYEFNGRAGVILVGHFGISGSRVAVTDLTGRIIEEASVSYSFSDSPSLVIEQLSRTFDDLLDNVDVKHSPLYGIGIGVPSLVDLPLADKFVDLRAEWNDYPFSDNLASRYDTPVLVENDVNLLAIGEYRASWPDVNAFLCVKVGTGVGAGIVINGELFRGTQGLAGQIGHVRVTDDAFAPCRCGSSGCLTAVVGGAALAARLRAQGFTVEDARDVARLARDGVPEAAWAVRQAGREVGGVLADAVSLLNPDVIAIWGYLADTQDHLFAGIRESVYQRSAPEATQQVRLVRCALGQEAGITGAALVVMEHVLNADAIDEWLQEPSAMRSTGS